MISASQEKEERRLRDESHDLGSENAEEEAMRPSVLKVDYDGPNAELKTGIGEISEGESVERDSGKATLPQGIAT